MKKLMRKLLAVVAAMTMVLGMSGLTAFAQTSNYTGSGASDGSITVTNTAAGHTYTLYKLFDAKSGSEEDNAGITYQGTIPSELSDYFQKNDATGTIEITAAGKGTDGQLSSVAAGALVTWASTATALTSAEADQSGTIEFTGLPYGYYVVTSDLKQGGAVSVTSTNKHGEVHEKNNSDGGKDTEKKIVTGENEDGTKQTASTSSAKIGDTVSYQITFTAVNYDSNNQAQKQYQLIDTNSGINIKKSTIKVHIGTQEITDYTVSEVTSPLTITIPWANTTGEGENQKVNSFKYNAPVVVTITYDATLTSTTGDNEAQVNGNGIKSNTHIYTAKYDLTKVAKESKNDKTGAYSKTLTGAEFDLYDTVTGGTQIKVSQKTEGIDGAYVVDPDGNAKIKTDANGHFTIEGLKQGTNYYLAETKAPDGYTLPTERKQLTASTGTKTANETVTENIENSKGAELPSTGGMGTTIFYILGAALVIGAGVVLVTRRRLSK